jgi:hypothetical protein
MQSPIKEQEPVLAKNPYNGKWYNITPLFTMLSSFNNNFTELADYMEKAGEILPFMIENEEHSRIDILNCSQILFELKRAMRSVKAIET